MKRLILITLLLLSAAFQAAAQKYTFSGTVTDKRTGEPVDFATVVVEGSGQWAMADAKGRFTILNVPASKTRVTVSCLGYVTWSREIQIQKDILKFSIALDPDNLALEGATVTAREDANSATTARMIDKTALEHVQMMNVADVSSLLPGGATVDPSLTSEKQFNIRAGSGESGNASFGTAVEVDGVRLSNNATYSSLNSTGTALKGVTTNSIASTNVESVEVITGVPSVEYGDMSSGVVKVNLKKGKTPWMVTLSTSPNTKQASVSKGLGLGLDRNHRSRGVVNASLEYTESIAKQMSPYTAYRREQMSLSYMNSLSGGVFASMPLRINFGVTGNLGGMNSQADPDLVQGTWSVAKDNAVRANYSLNWLLSKPWITNLELSGSVSYADKESRERTFNSSAINKTVLHGKEAGYYMAVPYSAGDVPPVMYIPGGYWYNVMGDDDRPLTTRMTLKANHSHFVGKANNKIKLGVDWSADRNFGVGAYSDDMATAPTFREYRYCDIPTMHNIGAYLEDNLMLPVGKGRLNLIAGLRSDNTVIRGSAYGVTSSLSPRFNAKWTILSQQGRERKAVRDLSVRASWGEAVKLPSFAMLFPMPTYRDVKIFTSTTNSANVSYEAYYSQPRMVEYNPDLRWQRNRMMEIGLEANILGNKISLTAYRNRTVDTYRISTHYDRTTYAYTSNDVLSGFAIPADDRLFSVNGSTGIVTVSDRTGRLPSQELPYQTYKELSPSYYPDNEQNPVDRFGVEWVIDFARIKAIQTEVRLDGAYYSYRSLGTNLIEYSPVASHASGTNLPYTYIGYYYGDNAYSNGSESKTLRTNITVTTHIPKVRMIVSAKLEASLLKYARTLSETAEGAELARTISNISDILSLTGQSIYSNDSYVVRYPEYYCSYDDPTLRNYLDDLKAAKAAGDTNLYNDLWQLSYRSNVLYTFRKDYLSPFFSANFSVTKEIGDVASISFYANNFFVNRAQIWSTRAEVYYTAANYIPKFYYGLTLRLKF